ncbi:MAG: aminomethyl-transferring glycine dehydrogenase subunit GcvPA [Candidatus Heimdallarchaeota archaeon]
MDFIPHDDKTVSEMLDKIGVQSLDELFQDIPKDLLISKFNLPEGLSEPDLLSQLINLSKKNKRYSHSFLGAGCYYHYIPSLVDFIIGRPEFYTSYTPYQAEASQGYLQAIYEYQTIISRLTGMDITNASMYDGSTALAEAAIMATIVTGRKKVLILEGLHPEYIQVIKTYCWGQDLNYEFINFNIIEDKLDEGVAAVIFQNPNFFGEVKDIDELVNQIREKSTNCLIIQGMTDPTCLGILKPPGETDIDIFVAEGQAFGIDPSFGGPGLGIFTAKQEFLRKMPGRLVGKTKELFGEKEGFILTLQAREQHIRREKASSNICTNQALCSLSALIYLLSLGKTGLHEIAKQNFQKSHFVKSEIAKIPGYEIISKNPTYNEFVLKCPNLKAFLKECELAELLPPLNLSYYFPKMENLALVCVTEMNSRDSIEKLIRAAINATNNKREEDKNE